MTGAIDSGGRHATMVTVVNRRVVVIGLFVTALLPSCGGDDDDETVTVPSTSTTATTTAAAPARVVSLDDEIRDFTVDGDTLWVATYRGLLTLDATSGEEIGRVEPSAVPFIDDVALFGDTVWAVSSTNIQSEGSDGGITGSILEVDRASGDVLGDETLRGLSPSRVVPGDANLLVLDGGNVVELAVPSLQETARIAADAAAMDADDDRLALVTLNRELHVIDRADGSTRWSATAVAPLALCDEQVWAYDGDLVAFDAFGVEQARIEARQVNDVTCADGDLWVYTDDGSIGVVEGDALRQIASVESRSLGRIGIGGGLVWVSRVEQHELVAFPTDG